MEEDDQELHATLGAWKVSPAPESDFNAGVWRRIALAERRRAPRRWTAVRDWLILDLPRPAYATGLIAAAVIVGILAANFQAARSRERYRLEQARHYLASIDPIAMMAAAPNRK